jgi:signal transduction histidine kinase
VGREGARRRGPVRGRTPRGRLGAALLSLALLPAVVATIAGLAERGTAAALPAPRLRDVALAIAAIAAAGVAMALSRRIAARIARLEAREARFRKAFEAATLASSLAEGAWLSRLDEEERRVSQRAAEWREENAELEGFAYAVSHDLRAPVRHLDAYVTLIRRQTAGSLDARSEHYLDAIAGAATRMGTLVDDLLSFLRLRHADLVPTAVDVGALVRELIAELGPHAAGRNVEWTVGDLPRLHADPRLFRLALANLLSNAVKFTRPRPRATIEIGSGSAPGDEVVLFVRDNGVGFDERHAGKLFQVFQRLHGIDEFEGTGIGLATVRRIVERHGGHVWAKSDSGQGATFFVSLPRETALPAPAPPGATPSGPGPA